MLRRTLFPILIIFLALTSCQSRVDANASASDLEFAYAKKIGDAELSLLGKEYNRVVVDASVYHGLMDMLGVGDKCIDFSDNMKLDAEKVVATNPDLLMLSAYEGADLEKYDKLGIPIVKCTDFLESSPLARAEWMRYFGRLWGVGEKADSLFSVVENNYKQLCIVSQSTKPNDNSLPSHGRGKGVGLLFFFDLLYGNQWYQPAENSTIGKLVASAGGKVYGGKNKQGGSVALSPEQVLMKAQNADVWIIRTMSSQPVTLETLAQMNTIYTQFEAYKKGNIFVCYTDKTRFFEETPFRPDWLLEDFKKIAGKKDSSPSEETETLRYFSRIK